MQERGVTGSKANMTITTKRLRHKRNKGDRPDKYRVLGKQAMMRDRKAQQVASKHTRIE